MATAARVLASGRWVQADVNGGGEDLVAVPCRDGDGGGGAAAADNGGDADGALPKVTVTKVHLFSVGDVVVVQPRTWAGYVHYLLTVQFALL